MKVFLKKESFQNSPKIATYFGYFCENIRPQDLSKISQTDYTDIKMQLALVWSKLFSSAQKSFFNIGNRRSPALWPIPEQVDELRVASRPSRAREFRLGRNFPARRQFRHCRGPLGSPRWPRRRRTRYHRGPQRQTRREKFRVWGAVKDFH